jgi:peptidoglycan-associated lipoprotein
MASRVLVVAALVFLVVLPGCPGRKKGPGAAGGEGAGLEERGVDTAGSLERYKAGEKLAGDSGPLKDVHFAFDSYELDDEARAVLRENANWLLDHPREKVEIEGHCDERGTVEYNLALGAKRARAVKDYLVSLGVAADRMTTISYGEELPLCTEHNEECWARNRRAHFVLLGD